MRMMQEVGLLSSERLVVAGDINWEVQNDRAEYEDYNCVHASSVMFKNNIDKYLAKAGYT